ncbi:hypothetical protein BHM03_00011086 [Ensete ventricosum]|nr:hypothetical protein BHM03_00011086 [Ensete ventricosum]
MALLDRVHDTGHLVTIMGNQASHLEAKIENLKSEGDPKQLVAAHQRVAELQADNAKKMSELGEYGYRVALVCFQAQYPDLEMDSNPFTKKPEDNMVPMETRQEFDDSVPAEE